jgi:hypothetical protein
MKCEKCNRLTIPFVIEELGSCVPCARKRLYDLQMECDLAALRILDARKDFERKIEAILQ